MEECPLCDSMDLEETDRDDVEVSYRCLRCKHEWASYIKIPSSNVGIRMCTTEDIPPKN